MGHRCPISRRTNTATENPLSHRRFLRPRAVSQAAFSLSRCEQSPIAPQRNVSLGTDTGWLSESQQPEAALAFLAIDATVLVTTIDLECTARAIGVVGTVGTTEKRAQPLAGKDVADTTRLWLKSIFSQCAQSIAYNDVNDCVNQSEHPGCAGRCVTRTEAQFAGDVAPRLAFRQQSPRRQGLVAGLWLMAGVPPETQGAIKPRS
jgi:hypothetical protein